MNFTRLVLLLSGIELEALNSALVAYMSDDDVSGAHAAAALRISRLIDAESGADTVEF